MLETSLLEARDVPCWGSIRGQSLGKTASSGSSAFQGCSLGPRRTAGFPGQWWWRHLEAFTWWQLCLGLACQVGCSLPRLGSSARRFLPRIPKIHSIIVTHSKSHCSYFNWAQSLHSCPALCDPLDCSPPGSSVHGIVQARTLEWGAMPSSRVSSWPRDRIWASTIFCITGGFFTCWATRDRSSL